MTGQPFLPSQVPLPADQPRITSIRMAVTENVLSDPAEGQCRKRWPGIAMQAIFLVAERRGRGGRGSPAPITRPALIWALFIDRGLRGAAASGGRLLDAALAVAEADAGHRQAWLTTGAGTRAERFYRAAWLAR